MSSKEESDIVLKRMEIGRDHDLDAAARISSILIKEKIEIVKDVDPEAEKIPYDKMSNSDLLKYKEDLKKRLMIFESESNTIRFEIKKIQNQINRANKVL